MNLPAVCQCKNAIATLKQPQVWHTFTTKVNKQIIREVH